MFNTICPNVYKTLRKRTGLSQDEFGEALGASRYAVSKFEFGRAQPDPEQERLILELPSCSQIEFVELRYREAQPSPQRNGSVLRHQLRHLSLDVPEAAIRNSPWRCRAKCSTWGCCTME